MGTLREDLRTFMIISHWMLLRVINSPYKSCRENQNTHFMFSNFFWKLCCLWDNVEKCCRARGAANDDIIQCMCSACWIPNATNSCSEYVIHIALPLQQWLREHASMLHYMYIACLVLNMMQYRAVRWQKLENQKCDSRKYFGLINDESL